MKTTKTKQKGGHFETNIRMNAVLSLVFHKNKLYSGSYEPDNNVRCWNIETGKKEEEYVLETTNTILYSDGDYLWAYDNSGTKITRIDTETGLKDVYRITHPDVKTIGDVKVIGNNIFFLCCLRNNRLKSSIGCYNYETSELKFMEEHSERLNRINVDLEDNTLWSTSKDGTIKQWDSNTLELKKTIQIKDKVDTSIYKFFETHTLNIYGKYLICNVLKYKKSTKDKYNFIHYEDKQSSIHLYNKESGDLLDVFNGEEYNDEIKRDKIIINQEIAGLEFKKDSNPIKFYVWNESEIVKFTILNNRIIKENIIGNEASDVGIWTVKSHGDYLYIGSNLAKILRVEVPLSEREARQNFTLPRTHPMLVQARRARQNIQNREQFRARLSSQTRRQLNRAGNPRYDSNESNFQWASTNQSQSSSYQTVSNSSVNSKPKKTRKVESKLTKKTRKYKTHKYNGKRYKIRVGSRGGKYIRVDGKKIYI